MVCAPDRVWRAWALASVIVLLKTEWLSLILRVASDKPKLKAILQNTWPVLIIVKALKTSQVWETHSQEESKKTWHIHAMWGGEVLDRNLEQKKDIKQKPRNLNNVWL